MPAFLATVPLDASVRQPSPGTVSRGNAVARGDRDQRTTADGIAVDSRVQARRTYCHALGRLLEKEQLDRIIISATGKPQVGLSGPDLLWPLDHTQGGVVILRPAQQDIDIISTDKLTSHF
jgi:hypothetical protein